MIREEFFKLVHELRPHISPDESSPNYRALTVEKKFSVALSTKHVITMLKLCLMDFFVQLATR